MNFVLRKKKILISAALQNFDVQISVFKAWSEKNNPCYECVFPKSNNLNNVNCDQMGIVSPRCWVWRSYAITSYH